MGLLTKNFRLWWQKPLSSDRMHEEREVSFLELFYDLIYVVIFMEMAHYLAHHLGWSGLGEFVFMFTFVFWAWLNGMLYHALHGTNDISMRVFTFLQMVFLGGLTIFVTDIFGSGSGVTGFAISWGLFQLLFTAMWFRTGLHDRKHRQASYQFTAVYLLSALAMFYSASLDPTTARNVWLGVISVNLLVPLYSLFTARDRKYFEETLTHSMDGIERFGLITIIALGEVIISTINGVNNLEAFTFRSGLIGTLGIGMAIGLWWLYSDLVSRRLVRHGAGKNMAFAFLHLPLTMSIVAAGGVLNEMILHSNAELGSIERWLFVGAISVSMLTIGAMVRIIKQPTAAIQKYSYKASKITMLCGLLIASIGFTNSGYVATLLATFIILLLPVLYGVRVWIKTQRRQRD